MTDPRIESARVLFAGPCDFVAGAETLDRLPPITLPEFGFVGRSNVGKSSLVNAVTGRKTLARVSHTPGRTQQLNFFNLSQKLLLVDMPGYGFAKVSKAQSAAWNKLIRTFLRGRASLRCVFILIDSRHGIKDLDRDVMKLLDEAADTIQVSMSANKIKFAFDHIILTTKLIDGTFPDYGRVIPANNDKMVEVDPKVFSSAIDRVSTISDGKTRALKITLNGKTMTLSASSPESGSATEDIEVHSEAPNIEIGFNARYLMDITSQVDGAACRIKLSDSTSPTIIEDTSDASSLYVIMPLRV